MIEEIDVGGVALLRAAAKNHDGVIVLHDSAQYAEALAALERGVVPEDRRRWALAAFVRTARYDTAIATELARRSGEPGEPPAFHALLLERARALRYGENPHQRAALYARAGSLTALPAWREGKELSYNNLLDLEAAVALVWRFRKPACVIVKHNQPCGAACAASLVDAARGYMAHLDRGGRMIDAIAAQLPFPTSLIGPLLHNRTTASLVLRLVPEKSRSLAGPLFYNTVTPTVLKAGGKTNVIPSLAEAQLDCRILPGQTPEDVIREIQAVVGPDVKLEILTSSTGAEFSTDNEMYRLMAKATQAMDPGGLVFPMLMMGATDACQYKNAGIQMYGFTPGLLPKDFPSVSLAHGHDERIPLSYVESGLPVLWQVVEEICA